MAGKSHVEIRDLGKIRMISDPQISPDGGRVAFFHTRMDFKKDEYVNDIWLAEAESGKVAQFTGGRGRTSIPGGPQTGNTSSSSRPPRRRRERRRRSPSYT